MTQKFNNLIIFVVAVFSLCFLNSCSHEVDRLFQESTDKQQAILEAKSWYEANKPQPIRLLSSRTKARSDSSDLSCTPNWNYAGNVKHTDMTVVQVPLDAKRTFSFVAPESKQMYDQTGDNRYMASLTEMVVKTDKKTQQKEGFLMTTLPDKEYMESTGFKPFNSTYKQWPDDYSGLILYHNLNGQFVNGWKIDKGRVTRPVVLNEGTNAQIRLNAPGIESPKRSSGSGSFVDVWSRTCWDNYTGTAGALTYQYTNCGEWHLSQTYELTLPSPSSGIELTGSFGGGVGDNWNQPDANGGGTVQDDCQQIQDELDGLLNDQSLSSNAPALRSNRSGGCGCGSGQINRNGQVVNWNSIANNAEVYQGITINHSKNYFDNAQAISYIKNKRDTYSTISNIGVGAFSGAATGIIDKVLKWLIKGGTSVYTCLSSAYAAHYSGLSSLYSNLYDVYNEKTSRNGLFVVMTRMTVTGAPVSNCNVTEEYYDGNGCLITTLNYNE